MTLLKNFSAFILATFLPISALAGTALAKPDGSAAPRVEIAAAAAQSAAGFAADGESPATPGAAIADGGAGEAVVQGYLLGVDDRIAVTVFGEPDLSKELQIGPSGTIEVPLIGSVKATGRTADDLRAEIARRLADGYLRNPDVTVAIVAFRPFFILGEVNKPGQYPYRKGLTVLGAVATAEGFTYRAQKKWVIIKHENDGTETRTEITPSLLVRPGDTIRVAERYF